MDIRDLLEIKPTGWGGGDIDLEETGRIEDDSRFGLN